MEKVTLGSQKLIPKLLIIMTMLGAATLLRVFLSSVVGTGVPLILYLIPVMLSGLIYGFWAGLLSTCLGVLLGILWFMPMGLADNISRVGVFMCVGTLFASIGGRARHNNLKIKELLKKSIDSAASEKLLRKQIESKDKDRFEILKSLEQTNAQLEKSQVRFERVAVAANLGNWSWISNSNEMVSSNACNELLGVPKGEPITTKLILNCIHPEDRSLVCTAVDNSMSKNQVFDVEFRTFASGISLSKWVRAAGWVDHNNGVSSLYGITIDITNHKRAIEELESARTIAERASDAKSRFLAQMSHEIRSPMNAILGFTQILIEESGARTQDEHEHLKRIKANGDHLMHVINDILDLSKFEAGKIAVERSRFSPVALVEDVVSSFRPSADLKGLTLEFFPSLKVPVEMVSDPSRLRQILFNLVGNALKFTEAGSVKITLEYAQGFLHFKIADTGAGLSEDQISRLFRPFEQADSSTNRKFGGTGLGLVLSRHLAQALGGDLTLYSAGNGQGCSFSFTIATGEGESLYPLSSGGVVAKNAAIDLDDLNILLAEDSPDGAAIVTRLLTRAKAQVKIAASGFEVLEQTRLHDFDIILMDVQMPGMDGLEATRILRRSGYDKPIVALTAHALPEEKERSTRAGCDAHLTKPVDKNILLQAIKQHTQSRVAAKKNQS